MRHRVNFNARTENINDNEFVSSQDVKIYITVVKRLR